MRPGVVLKNGNGSRRSTCIVSLALMISFVFMLPCLFFGTDRSLSLSLSLLALICLHRDVYACIVMQTLAAILINLSCQRHMNLVSEMIDH